MHDTINEKITRNQQKIQQLDEMPTDILFEASSLAPWTWLNRHIIPIYAYQIFETLQPYDLLNLARTSKDLRAILMTRSSRTVWKRARSNMPGLPDCPEDISEPHYARLLFEVECHECGKAPKLPCTSSHDRALYCIDCLSSSYNFDTKISISWHDRARLCNDCISNHFLKITRNVYKLPCWFTSCMPSLEVLEAYGQHSSRYRAKTVTLLLAEYQSLGNEAKEEWISEKKEKCMVINEHGKLCDAWLERQEALLMQKFLQLLIS